MFPACRDCAPPHRIPEPFRGDRFLSPDRSLGAADEMSGLGRKAVQADRSR